MTCKDCIGYDFCSDYEKYSEAEVKEFSEQGTVQDLCSFFKNKADFVEVETVKAWLWAVAHNNVGNPFGEACKELTTRLDGLRNFEKEIKG